jgi:hypothetical protein
MPVSAMAQPASKADLAYCTTLSNTYVHYIGHGEDNSNRLRNLAGWTPRSPWPKCKQGAPAIPVLERKLTEQKFALPARG